jgi:hypothetical protein
VVRPPLRRGVASFSSSSSDVDPPNEAPTEKSAATTTAVDVAEPSSAEDDSATSDDGGAKVRLYPVYSRYDVEDLLSNEDLASGNEETYARDAAVAMIAPLNTASVKKPLGRYKTCSITMARLGRRS